MALTLSSLITAATRAQLYEKALAIATALGLPVTSWAPGDPTRSLFHFVSAELETLEGIVAKYIGSGFLDLATGDWLVRLAQQVYGYDARTATYATATVQLTNGGGGQFEIEAGALTFKSTTSGKTYHNTTGGTLLPSGSLSVSVVADEAGSASSALIGDIDSLVTTLLRVSCSNTTAAVGLDAESEDSIRQACKDKLGALSPNGPADAYAYVARASSLTGVTTVTRSKVIDSSRTGNVVVYVAGASGAVGASEVAAVRAAIAKWATPQCMTVSVGSATAVSVPITYQLWVYQAINKTEAEIKAAVADAVNSMFAKRPIGGDVLPGETAGKLYLRLIETTIGKVFPEHTYRVSVSAPTGDIALSADQVAIAAVNSAASTITFTEDP